MSFFNSSTLVNTFFNRLKQVEHLNPERRHLGLKGFGRFRHIAEKYLSMHPDRRSDFLRSQRRKLAERCGQLAA